MKWLLIFLIFSLSFKNLEAQKKSPQPPNSMEIVPEPIPPSSQFPGGDKAWCKFLATNLKWPTGFDGQTRVIIRFVVEANGSLSNIKIVKNGSADCGAEALRVLKKSPKWVPAMNNGKPIRSKYSFP